MTIQELDKQIADSEKSLDEILDQEKRIHEDYRKLLLRCREMEFDKRFALVMLRATRKQLL